LFFLFKQDKCTLEATLHSFLIVLRLTSLSCNVYSFLTFLFLREYTVKNSKLERVRGHGRFYIIQGRTHLLHGVSFVIICEY